MLKFIKISTNFGLYMQTFNHLFSSPQRFSKFLDEHNIKKDKKHFIQIFIGDNNPKKLQNVLDTINNSLPYASSLGVSTAGEIIEGGMNENSTVISVTTFEETEVTVKLIEKESATEMAQEVLSDMIQPNTKLILAFNNVYSNDAEDFLEILQDTLPSIPIAGGNAGDNGAFSFQTIVAVNKNVSTTAIAVATFHSDKLQVFNDLLFNWHTIGESMQITKSDKNIIYEINHQKTQDIYKHFLGEEVASNLPLSAVEFPLIFKENGLEIARAPVAIGENGELIMAGHIKNGATVRFGFCDVTENDINVVKTIENFATKPIESIFIYSCSARKYLLKYHLNVEFEMLQKIAPTSGFITYGEFFSHKQCNKMLNVSSTFIGLSENTQVRHNINIAPKETSLATKTLHALTHLVRQTSKSIEDKNLHLSQFEHLIQEATIYSATDTKGIIIDVNQKFIDISGYSREELIGKNHNIVRHKDILDSVYKDLWHTIEAKKSWKGIIKNRSKDGKDYYVRSNIFPILNSNGDILKYISIRDDITQEIQQQELLTGSIHNLEEISHSKEYLLKQYESIINLNNSFFRVNAELQIIHANDVFCKLYCCNPSVLQTKALSGIIEENFFKENAHKTLQHLQEHGNWSGTIPFKREDKKILYMKASANTIYNKDGKLIEIMIVMNDITDLINAHKEIESVQRDVIYTMGAIGETRSRETGNHVKRVAEYSKLFALKYGLSKKQAELLKMASPMHDIGKVGIPDSILNKPGKLTEDEWTIMKRHASLGYSMLRRSKRKILKTAAIVAYTHHEKWDGSGYPKKIKGKSIHLFGRITAIADVFDALGSDRCYKKAWPDEKILQLIKEQKGKHFDPQLVNIFFENLDSFLSIRDSFQD